MSEEKKKEKDDKSGLWDFFGMGILTFVINLLFGLFDMVVEDVSFLKVVLISLFCSIGIIILLMVVSK